MSRIAPELVHRHLTTSAQPPRELDPEIPEPLSRLVMKLLAKDPEERYQSAGGLAHDLASADGQAGQPMFVLAARDVPGSATASPNASTDATPSWRR